MKTAEEIVLKLANADEPYYFVKDENDADLCYCALCPAKGHEDDDRVRVLDPKKGYEDGLSIMGHDSGCAWRQAVEYATAAKKAAAKKGKRK